MGPRSNASLLTTIESAGAEEADLTRRWGGVFRVPAGDGWVTAVSERGGGVLNATKAVAMFQALAVKKGAVVRDKTEVVDIRKEEGGVVVTTSAGTEFHGAKCVVTVGSWRGARPDMGLGSTAMEPAAMARRGARPDLEKREKGTPDLEEKRNRLPLLMREKTEVTHSYGCRCGARPANRREVGDGAAAAAASPGSRRSAGSVSGWER